MMKLWTPPRNIITPTCRRCGGLRTEFMARERRRAGFITTAACCCDPEPGPAACHHESLKDTEWEITVPTGQFRGALQSCDLLDTMPCSWEHCDVNAGWDGTVLPIFDEDEFLCEWRGRHDDDEASETDLRIVCHMGRQIRLANSGASGVVRVQFIDGDPPLWRAQITPVTDRFLTCGGATWIGEKMTGHTPAGTYVSVCADDPFSAVVTEAGI